MAVTFRPAPNDLPRVLGHFELVHAPGRGDRDGRGALTQVGLVEFCGFFLRTCLDQVRYMTSILEPQRLLRWIDARADEEARAGRRPRGAYPILREALLRDELSRGDGEGGG